MPYDFKHFTLCHRILNSSLHAIRLHNILFTSCHTILSSYSMPFDFKLFTPLPYDFKLFSLCLMSIHNTIHPMPYKFTVTLNSMSHDSILFTPCHTNLWYTLHPMPYDLKLLTLCPSILKLFTPCHKILNSLFHALWVYAVWRIQDVYPGSRIPDPDFYPSRILDPGSRIPDPGSRIPDPGSRISDPGSRISDPGSRIHKQQLKGGVKKKIFSKFFFVATNFTKCKIILFFNCSRKKFGPNFKELWNFSPKKLSLRSKKSEFGIRDPRSGIQNKPIPDPGSWIQGSKRHRIPDPQPLSIHTIYSSSHAMQG